MSVAGGWRERREPPVLDRERLLAACGCPADVQLVEDVVDAACAGAGEMWPHELWLCCAAALRALLAPHRPVKAGRCGQCAADWPCWTWREAHDWIGGYDPIHGGRVYDWTDRKSVV